MIGNLATVEPVVLILCGLPGAGKSTWANAWVEADPQRRRVVNRDSVRFDLFGEHGALSEDQEAAITEAEHVLAECVLGEGLSIVVDATNLVREHLEAWVAIAGRFGVRHEVVTLDTSLDECLRRNRARAAAGGRFVPEDVIVAMSEALTR